jgi:hypothetical protein
LYKKLFVPIQAELLVTVVNFRTVSISGIYLQRDGFCAGRLLPIAFSSLRQAQENQDGRGQGRASPEGSAMAWTLMVNIYCPACHISSPREPRELSQLRSFCTVCGAPLNETVVEAAVALSKTEQRD